MFFFKRFKIVFLIPYSSYILFFIRCHSLGASYFAKQFLCSWIFYSDKRIGYGSIHQFVDGSEGRENNDCAAAADEIYPRHNVT